MTIVISKISCTKQSNLLLRKPVCQGLWDDTLFATVMITNGKCPVLMLNSSIGSGGSDAVFQTAPEKAATPYTTIQIFSSSAAQEITK